MKTAVFIGRFQPPHLAHLETMTRALARFEQLVVVIGSALCYPTPKNPFSAEQLEAMIRESLRGGAGRRGDRGEKDPGRLSSHPFLDAPPSTQDPRLHFVPIPDDFYDDPRWFRSVRSAVEAIAGKDADICITGFDKDQSSYYLHGFGNWPFEPSGVVSKLNATDVRNSYFAGGNEWKTMVPEAVRRFMEHFATTSEFSRLQAEWKTLEHFRWLDQRYPYPIVHVATDAMVLAQGQVLLVERGGSLSKGAWALPGGYVELKETLLESALRELQEETGLQLQPPLLKATKAFDYPGRSLRGRVISHGHYFDLDDTPPPPVHGQDDASRAFWLSLSELPRHQARFFEDHYQEIRWFVERHL
ncbi:bifunctional nicotinamide-nucleotide adenylyltransferase/Nudix hydroxylase [uncultured Meiothermus sp.]|jgi:bifunctional NMN adenylyltransferase/nudix hydrolase|uniref:bifunctional nicotinamide-nucleotide adenylyltransferase/Nudix hydroxylase n=1 Tax=uncultured Meiothermus sp. TaxID=157471 RepID=UPI0026344646|nr:bifunctional nicotinamide-nucleotide adenylyltransferase/Nudix hydroxylase [uncultured Meiothermus sp.]